MGLRANILAGKGNPDATGAAAFATEVFESGMRRAKHIMCGECVHGMHQLCKSENCPCVCNDSDFRWARRTNPEIATSDPELARVLMIRPELRPLFNLH